MLEVGKKYLITCDNWFTAPDGKSYSTVFGTVSAILDSEQTLGIRTNARSTNWYVEIGNMVVAGCQIHYVIQTDTVHFGDAEQYATEAGTVVRSIRPSVIYDADRGEHHDSE